MDWAIVLLASVLLFAVGCVSYFAVGWFMRRYLGESISLKYTFSDGAVRTLKFRVPAGKDFNEVLEKIKQERGIK